MILEEIKMVEDTPDDLVHEIFTEHYWRGHPLGRPILGVPADGRGARPRRRSPATSPTTYVASNFIVSAAGNLEHDRLSALVERGLRRRAAGRAVASTAPARPTAAA